jgi:hypothetical protein
MRLNIADRWTRIRGAKSIEGALRLRCRKRRAKRGSARAEDTEDAGGPFAILRLQLTSKAVEAPAGQTEPMILRTTGLASKTFGKPPPAHLMQPGNQSDFPVNLLYFQLFGARKMSVHQVGKRMDCGHSVNFVDRNDTMG